MDWGLIKSIGFWGPLVSADKKLTAPPGDGLPEVPLINSDVYWHEAQHPVSGAQLLGTFKIGEPIVFKVPIAADTDIALRTIGRSARGLRTESQVSEANPDIYRAGGLGGGGFSLRQNHGWVYGVNVPSEPKLNFINAFQLKDDTVFGETDISTFGVPTGLLNLRTDKLASGVIAVTTGTIAAGALTTLTLAGRLDLQPGSGIYISGAGPSGAALITTVTSNSENGLVLHLATAASAPVTGVLVQADDTAAVQSWISAKGDLAMPPGYYRLTSSILFPPASEGFSIIIHGAGWDLSVFAFQNIGDGFVTDTSNPANLRFDSIVFKDCTIATAVVGDSSGTVSSTNRGHGFRLTAPDIYGIYDQLVLERVRVIGWGRFGIWSDNLEVSWLHDCIFRLNKSGHVAFIAPDEIGPNKQPNANIIDSCTFDQAFSDPATHRTGSGSMTAGSNVLSVSGITLTAADRGRAVIVQGGGVSGAFIYSFIDAVLSSSQAQLTYNAQSGAPGVGVEILATNIASIFLNRANDTTISGCTIQGNFAKDSTGANVATPLANDCNAIRADECFNLRIVGVHEEDNAGWGGAAVRLARCKSVTIENYGGTSPDPALKNGHGQDIQLIDSHGVRVSQCYFNDRPQFVVDGLSTEIEIDNSFITGHNNIWQHDSSWDRVKVGSGVRTQQSANQLTNQLGGSEYIYDSLFGRDLLRNGRFTDGVGGLEGWTNSQPTWWSNPFSSLLRFGSYVKVNATAIADNGGIATTILNQTVAIPDTLEGGEFCLAFDWYIENEAGSASVSGRFTEVRLHPSSGIDEALQWVVRGFPYVQQRWQTAQMHCFLNAGTSRTIDVQIRATPGPNNVIIRIANLRLSAGKHSFGSYERAVHDFGGRMRAPLELMAIASVNYPPPPTTGQDSSMISLVNLAGVLNLGKGGVYTPISTAASGATGHTIQEDGTALTQRANLNFVGAAITAADDPVTANNRTNVSLNPATASAEGIVSISAQTFAGRKQFNNGVSIIDTTGGTDVALVVQDAGVSAGSHIQEWWTTGVTPMAFIDTQPTLRLGIPGGADGFLELCSAGVGSQTVKLACGIGATAAQVLFLPKTFPAAGNLLQVATAGAGNVQLQWASGSTGITMMEEGGALIQRDKLNFVGAGITAADDIPNTRVNVTLNAATQTTEGIVSTTAQNFGGRKTFFAGATMQGTAASEPVLTVQGQASSGGALHLQEWKDNGGVFSLGYFTMAATLRVGNPSAYTGALELCSASSSNYTALQAAATPAASLVYVLPANTPTASQVLGVLSIAGSTVNLTWQTAGGTGANIFLSNLAESNPADHSTSQVLINTWLLPATDADGTAAHAINIGGGASKKFNAAYFYSGVFVYPAGSSSGSPRAFGFIPSASPGSTGECSRFLVYGDRNNFQAGDQYRHQISSYWGLEIRGSRLNSAPPGYISGLTTDPCVSIIPEVGGNIALLVKPAVTITNSLVELWNNTGNALFSVGPHGELIINTVGTSTTPIFANGASGLTQPLFRLLVAGTEKFRITSAGTIVAQQSGTILGVSQIQMSGGASYTLTPQDRTVVVDTAIQSTTIFLPVASSCRGQIYDIYALRQIQLILNSGAATGSGNVITITVQSPDEINGWAASGQTWQMNTASGRKAVRLTADAVLNIWWLIPYNI
jgi:hypothetical protein